MRSSGRPDLTNIVELLGSISSYIRTLIRFSRESYYEVSAEITADVAEHC